LILAGFWALEGLLITAKGTGDYRAFTIPDGDVIAQVISETDMMPAMKAELFPVQALDYLFQFFNVLIGFFLLFCHGFLQKLESHPEQLPQMAF
jgi:hypothetical protein